MNKKMLILITVLIIFMGACKNNPKKGARTSESENALTGTWIRVGHSGVMSLKMGEDGHFEVDMGRDQIIDVSGTFIRKGDTLNFEDNSGVACPESGSYTLYTSENYIAFDVLDDMCGGRIKNTMGFWVAADFKKRLKKLDHKIENTQDPGAYLERARMQMALGESAQAKKDFQSYLKKGKPDARVYINLAGTFFPDDLQSAILACNKAIVLDPEAKNAYFLRGLARYMSGQEEDACDDFGTAIALGFSVLRIAEEERCSSYWNQ